MKAGWVLVYRLKKIDGNYQISDQPIELVNKDANGSPLVYPRAIKMLKPDPDNEIIWLYIGSHSENGTVVSGYQLINEAITPLPCASSQGIGSVFSLEIVDETMMVAICLRQGDTSNVKIKMATYDFYNDTGCLGKNSKSEILIYPVTRRTNNVMAFSDSVNTGIIPENMDYFVLSSVYDSISRHFVTSISSAVTPQASQELVLGVYLSTTGVFDNIDNDNNYYVSLRDDIPRFSGFINTYVNFFKLRNNTGILAVASANRKRYFSEPISFMTIQQMPYCNIKIMI